LLGKAERDRPLGKPRRGWKLNVKTDLKYVGFEVLTAVVMKSTTFWDITPCNPLKVNPRFGRTYRLHLQLCLPHAFRLVSCSAYSSTLKMEAMFLGNVG
jgi:hypothetical protein